MHNDFKVDNCQFAPGDPDKVATVFDWDMATLGDTIMLSADASVITDVSAQLSGAQLADGVLA